MTREPDCPHSRLLRLLCCVVPLAIVVVILTAVIWAVSVLVG